MTGTSHRLMLAELSRVHCTSTSRLPCHCMAAACTAALQPGARSGNHGRQCRVRRYPCTMPGCDVSLSQVVPPAIRWLRVVNQTGPAHLYALSSTGGPSARSALPASRDATHPNVTLTMRMVTKPVLSATVSRTR